MSVVSAPAGEVTLMFTDIEGSTKGWDTYREAFRDALDVHNRLMREAIALHDGYEVKTIGDSFMVAFSSALSAAECAIDMLRRVEAGPFETVGGIRVRIGLHTGTLQPFGGDYFGPTVNHAARIESSAHGGQIVLSEATALLLQDRLPDEAALHDDGLHRLKDLGAPIRLYRLTSSDLPVRDYPALRTLDPQLNNFPAQVTSLIGREQECAALLKLLRDTQRLITLTGAGGTGKTRLAMQVAAEAVQDYPDGIWLVELAGLSAYREVPSATALALKIPLAADQSIPSQVFSFLKEKRCLIVFDNFEHVVDAAPFVSDLLKNCRGVACLVTSQHLLQIAGETEFALEPLGMPPRNASVEAALRSPSVQLFVERAQAARAQFAVTEESLPPIVELCRRLDGNPLALELTAALVRAITPAQILPRLNDRFKLLASTRRDLDPRQRSLRGALDWSYELLNEDERALFAEISVFAGGFRVEDLEAICTGFDPLMTAFSLRDKSLIKTEDAGEEVRYRMLESLRLYAADKLEQSGAADEQRERHARHYLGIAQELREQLNSSGEAMQRMTVEIDNMRAGMDWAIEHGDAELSTAYALALARFFVTRGLYDESERRLSIAEVMCRRSKSESDLAKVLAYQGQIAMQRSDHELANQFYSESLQISLVLHEQDRVIASLANLGSIAWLQNDLETAGSKWEQALALAREIKQEHYEPDLLSHLSLLASDQGNFDKAIDYLEQSSAMHRAKGDKNGLGFDFWHHGETLMHCRQFEMALDKLNDSKALFDEIGYSWASIGVAAALGTALMEVGDLKHAEEQLTWALNEAKAAKDERWRMLALTSLGELSAKMGDTASARQHFRESILIATALKDERQVAEILRRYGTFLASTDQLEAAYPMLLAAKNEFAKRGHHSAGELASQLELLKNSSEDPIDWDNDACVTAELLVSNILAE